MDTKSLNDISLGETVSNYSFDPHEEVVVPVGGNSSTTPMTMNGVEVIVKDKEYTEDEIEDFKDTAKKYFKIDDELKVLQKKIIILRKEKNKYTKDILDFMEHNSIKDVNTNSGKLRYMTTYKKAALNKKYIKSKLAEYFKNNDKALDCYKFIDNVTKTAQSKLKRY